MNSIGMKLDAAAAHNERRRRFWQEFGGFVIAVAALVCIGVILATWGMR